MSEVLQGHVSLSTQFLRVNPDTARTFTPGHRVSHRFHSGGLGDFTLGKVYESRLTLQPSTPVDVDLQALTDDEGAALSFGRVLGINVVNLSTLIGRNVTVGGASSNAWGAPWGDVSDTALVGPRGWWSQCSPLDGFEVTSSSKVLRLDPGSNTVQVHLLAWGRIA